MPCGVVPGGLTRSIWPVNVCDDAATLQLIIRVVLPDHPVPELVIPGNEAVIAARPVFALLLQGHVVDDAGPKRTASCAAPVFRNDARAMQIMPGVAPMSDTTLAYWKVLELSFDGTSLPYLIQEHHYEAVEGLGATIIPETTVEDTARAVRELVAAEAVRLADDDHTLTPSEVEAVLSDASCWDPATGALSVEVVNLPKAADLLRERPPSANPHKPQV